MDKLWARFIGPVPPSTIPVQAALLHPFYPIDIEIAGYVANDKDVLTMLAEFFSGWVVILGLTWLAVGRISPRMKLSDKLTLLWFVLTGTIHFFFEGYFSVNNRRMGAMQDLFGQLWKEYALSDSRYLTSDPFVLCMETVTAFLWGPLSYVSVYLILTSHPMRYPIQSLVCIGQMYGLVLYYATSLFDLYHKGSDYCRPEPYYFYFYFFFMNFIWAVIPGYILYDSFSTIGKAFAALQRMSASAPGNGAVKLPKANGHLKNQ